MKVMVDTGAINSFMADREIGKLKLKMVQHTSRIKIVNSDDTPI